MKRSDWCTGFLVSQDLMMTASHCFRAAPSLCSQTVALFGYDNNLEEPVVARACESVVYLNPYLDVAVVRLENVEGEMPIVSIASEIPSAEDQLLLAQHPYGSVRLISRDAGCKVTQSVAPLEPSRKDLDYSRLEGLGFAHGCDTLEGSSGSPVFNSEGEVVGVHQGGKGSKNKAVRGDLVRDCIAINQGSNTVEVVQPSQAACSNWM
nr:serine protease [Paracoccus sp. MC1854]